MSDFAWDKDNPLIRAKTETTKANAALHDYVMMGAGRSLQKLHQRYTKDAPREPPTKHLRTLKKWSSCYDWQSRIEAWEEAERERERQEYEAERLEWRGRRRQMLQGFFSQLAKALQKFDPEGATLGQLTQAVRTVTQELRAEYDDLPTERHDVTTGGQPIAITTIEVVKDYGDEPISDH